MAKTEMEKPGALARGRAFVSIDSRFCSNLLYKFGCLCYTIV